MKNNKNRIAHLLIAFTLTFFIIWEQTSANLFSLFWQDKTEKVKELLLNESLNTRDYQIEIAKLVNKVSSWSSVQEWLENLSSFVKDRNYYKIKDWILEFKSFSQKSDINVIRRNIRLEVRNLLLQNWYKDWNSELPVKNLTLNDKEESWFSYERKIRISEDPLYNDLKEKTFFYKWEQIFKEQHKIDLFNLLTDLKLWTTKIDLKKYKEMKSIKFILDEKEMKRLIDDWSFWVVTSRERVNSDASYRLHNIKTAFSKIWNEVVLEAWKEISFINSISYDWFWEKKLYKDWYSIVWWKEVKEYGWWLCWAATALYQWALQNKWIQIQSQNHSKWFSSLYIADFEKNRIKTPWNDATIYYYWNKNWSFQWIDLKLKNTTTSPIYLFNKVIEKDKKKIEQNFTLWNLSNKWSLEFIEKKWNCYTWKINWNNKTSCYKSIE